MLAEVPAAAAGAGRVSKRWSRSVTRFSAPTGFRHPQVRAFSGLRARAANARILIALVDVAAGVVAIAYPTITAVALVVIVAIWAIAFGVLEMFAASGAGETAGTRAWFVVAGLVCIAFGFVLVGRPDVGAVSLAMIYGIFSLAFGVTEIVLGVQARRAVAAPRGLATA